MYGTFMGKVIGTMTDIDGSIQTVGMWTAVLKDYSKSNLINL